VVSKTVPQAASGPTSLVLDPLPPNATYYWRVRAAATGAIDAVSAAASFTIVAIQPPVPVQPRPNSLQHRRPTLVVTNAVRTGSPASLTYRFEIATDAAFSALVASGSVPEGPSQTSFTPSSDLVSGVVFYWRVRVVDTATSVTSAYSTTQSFATIAPDDGVWNYHLVLRTPACVERIPGFGDVRLEPQEFPFDGTLTVSGQTLRFKSNDNYYKLHYLLVDITRVDDRLSGTISTRSPAGSNFQTAFTDDGWEVGIVGTPVFAGSASLTGRLTATFDGTVLVWNRYGDGGGGCTAARFTWVLTPLK
jgi:hypothetical protein